MADKSVFSRLRRLFSTDVIIRNVGGNQIKTIDSGHVQSSGVYETNVARYKLYQTFGPVDIDPHTIHSDFKKVEIVEKIDKSKARKAAIAAFNAGQEMPPGIDIDKVKRVKRT